MESINFSSLDKKWQKEWEKAKIFEAHEDPKKEKYYALAMYPYPSANGLHMGHAFQYLIPDILSRYMRMNGKSVLHPMGFDSFGLPAENAAINEGAQPRKYTDTAIKRFIIQLKTLGISYDWSRIIQSHDKEYYKWNQYFFLQLLKKGLAYRKASGVNWCSKCESVLANEQVHDGKCWRHKENNVTIKNLEQWFIKTTKYAEELLKDVDKLDWPERIKSMQKNWIGKSEGAEVLFEIPYSKEVNFVLLHGHGGSPNSNFFPWLKNELEHRGYEVSVSRLPEPDSPNIDKKVEYVLKEEKITENTVIIGHSLGGAVSLQILEKLNKPIKKLVLVAGALRKEFNFDKIRKNVKDGIIYLRDENDTVIPKNAGDMARDLLGAQVVNFKAEEMHICALEEPEVLNACLQRWPVFTTRVDTLFGVTFLVISAQHSKLNELVTKEQKKYVDAFLKKVKSTKQEDMDKMEKEGVFTGSYAVHPLTGKKIPIWTGNFVVADYGSGMVMAVPAHDSRDYEFAKKYDLEIKPVIFKEIKESYSYVMGIDENDIKKIGATIVEKTKDGFFKIKIPFDKLEDYKEFIRKNMKPNFWNEFSTKNGFYFIFKHKNGKLEEIELNKKTNDIIDNYGMVFNGKEPNKVPKNVYSWLADNSFYKEILIHTEGGILVNSEAFNGLNNNEAKEHIIKALEVNKMGRKVTQYKLRDWLISRQRYWGTPIPIIYCSDCGAVPVNEKDLPVILPEKVEFGRGNPLITNEKFVNTKCPNCGRKAKRETDTMDTFVDSSWYYLRFTDPSNNQFAISPDCVSYWMPVDFYSGGAEHACMHLIYARFFTKVLRDFGYIKFDEPFPKLFNQGMLHGEDGFVMSKSRGNGIDPLDTTSKYGSDTLRLFLMSVASPDKDFNWSSTGIESMYRFVNRVWNYTKEVKFGKSSFRTQHKLNKAIIEIGNEIKNLNYNIAVIKLRALFDAFEDEIDKSDFAIYLQLLSPFAPHISEELWHNVLGYSTFVSNSKWPISDNSKINESIDKAEEVFERTVMDIQNILKIIKEKDGKEVKHVYLYTIPHELNIFDKKILSKRIGTELSVFAVNDKTKYDPQGKASKAKPGKPGIYVE